MAPRAPGAVMRYRAQDVLWSAIGAAFLVVGRYEQLPWVAVFGAVVFVFALVPRAPGQ